jgi:hypothetical protein
MSRRVVHIAVRLIVSAGLLLYAIIVFAHESGITGLTRKNPDPNQRGCTCHSGTPSSNVTVSIVGPDTLVIGQRALYTLTISGGPAVKGGTNIAASGGTLEPLSSSLQLFQGELTHTAPLAFSTTGQVSFPFAYTAPTTVGVQTLYANGNSTNGNGNPLGDQWNFAPDKQITIVTPVTAVEPSAPPVPISFRLAQNFPNPFNPTTRISYEIPTAARVTVRVFDLAGRQIATLVDEFQPAGQHGREFVAPSHLPSGTYVYTINAGTFTAQKTMTLVK